MSTSWPGTTRARVVRWPAAALLTALVAVMVVVDSGNDAAQPSAVDIERPVVPTAGKSESLTSTWYCAAGTIFEDGPADHELVIANPSTTTAVVDLTVYSVLAPARIEINLESDGGISDTATPRPPEATDLGSVTATVTIGPRSVLRTLVGAIEGVGGEHGAVLIESNVGDMFVEHIVSGPNGRGMAPCASASAATWYFPAGSTRKGAREILSIFNPFPGDAVVDITFATEAGSRSPQIYDGLVVPSGTVLPVDITGVVTLFDSVSADINVRTGRVIVDRLLFFDGSEGPGGLSVSLGSTLVSEVWVFASSAPAGASDAIVIHNPSLTDEARVDVEVHLDVPEFNGTVEPIEVTLRPGRTEIVLLGGTPELISGGRVQDASSRIADDVGYWVGVRALDGVPVVAEHLTMATDPVPVAVSASPGQPVAATRLFLTTLDGTGEVVVVNPAADRIAALDLRVFVDGQDFSLAPIEVPQQSRVVLDLAALGVPPGAILVIESTEPVVGERRVSLDGAGSVTAGLVPMAGTASVVDLPLF